MTTNAGRTGGAQAEGDRRREARYLDFPNPMDKCRLGAILLVYSETLERPRPRNFEPHEEERQRHGQVPVWRKSGAKKRE
jgi:hypothetical protein